MITHTEQTSDTETRSMIQVTSLRLVREKVVEFEKRLTSSSLVAEMMTPFVEGHAQESFYVIGVDVKNRVNVIHQVAVGGGDAVSLDLKVILKVLLLSDSSGCIVCHNHPSGDPEPSSEDRMLTRKLGELLQLTSIRFLDHVVLGEERHFSFADSGLMP